MISGDGASECEWEFGKCHFNGTLFDIQREFHFEELGQALSSVAATFVGEPDNAFYFNICGEKTGDSRRSIKVQAEEGNPCAKIDGAFVCKKAKSGEVIALGRSVDIQLGLHGNASESGIHLTYTDLSAKTCFNNATGENSNYRTIVNIRCDMESETVVGPSITLIDPCTYKADFISSYGCPLCDDNDFVALEGNCDPQTLQKEIIYVKKQDKGNKCRGVGMPPKKVKCAVNVISAPYWIVAAVLGVAVLIIAALGGIALFFYYKFRDASSKFHQLSEGDDNLSTGRSATEMN
jgi:hypothetical protein